MTTQGGQHASHTQPLVDRVTAPEELEEDPPGKTKSRLIWIFVVLAIIGTVVAVVLVTTGGSDDATIPPLTDREAQFLSIPNGESTLAMLDALSEEVSLAGKAGSLDDAIYVQERFRAFGLETDRYAYRTLLSYPVSRSLTGFSAPANESITPRLDECSREEIDDESAESDKLELTWLAYAATGAANGRLIYVNYGRREDYQLLVDRGVDLEGAIGIARYGEMFRGLKIQWASNFSMAGLLIYSDPQDDGYGNCLEGQTHEECTYPQGLWRPACAVQMGSSWFINLFSGDPLTPTVAATEDLPISERQYTYEDTPNVPRIPAIPLSYADAELFLSQLRGTSVEELESPEDWQGGLDFVYHIGDVDDAEDEVTASIDVENDQILDKIFDVVATIKGSQEPERIVIVGGHRDGWTFGALDPHSSSAPVMEIARAFGQLQADGWVPKRTIKIVSWDAEEYGLHGSTEFAEEFQDYFRETVVAYLNVDVAVSGTYYSAGGSPSLQSLVDEVTKTVVNRATGEPVYNDWSGDKKLFNLGSGSDYTAFLDFLGVASLDQGYKVGVEKNGVLTFPQYGVYHSKFDSIQYFAKMFPEVDIYLETIAKVLGTMVLRLADADILPFNHTEYAVKLGDYQVDLIADLEQLLDDTEFAQIADELDELRDAIDEFTDNAAALAEEAREKSEDLADYTEEEILDLNDRLMLVERGFCVDKSEHTLHKRPDGFFRHTVYAPSFDYGYAGIIFPGPREGAIDGLVDVTQTELVVLANRIQCAAAYMRDSSPECANPLP